ncbi:hypothetical protein ABVF61_28945 [Roseibium sp. HPY-6]|uniref:tetratricopeptide repeat protein n=1 Tax=Roseibium sp. HPY-6 TaxID=3229852 RepID=UPI00338F23A5
MTHSLNTARALLEAKNFDGARRLVNEILQKKPDDISCWILRIKIETEAENHKEALRICRNVLKEHPENVVLRELEFDALTHLRRKREARRVFEKFKTDFPEQYIRIRNMQFSLDAVHGKTQQLNKYLGKFDGDDLGPTEKKNIGIYYHKTCNVFRAQEYMTDAHADFPDDLALNKTLAQNCLQLGKLAAARKYARIALRLSPGDRHMRALIAVSYAYYLPQFYLLNAGLMLINLCICYFGVVIGLVFGFLAGIYAFRASDFFERVTSIALNSDVFHGSYVFYGFLLSYFLVQHPKYFKFIYERKREVRLKRY